MSEEAERLAIDVTEAEAADSPVFFSSLVVKMAVFVYKHA